MKMRVIAALVGLISAALLLSACGGSRTTTANTCSSAYALSSPTTQARSSTTCDGSVGYPPATAKLQRGERFKVTGNGGNIPTLSLRGNAIKRVRTSGRPPRYLVVRSYVAVRTGKAELISKVYCQKPVNGHCVAFIISVS